MIYYDIQLDASHAHEGKKKEKKGKGETARRTTDCLSVRPSSRIMGIPPPNSTTENSVRAKTA